MGKMVPVTPLRSCASKVRYESEGEARHMRRQQIRDHGGSLYVYPCRFCEGFHLGHKRRKIRKP
jgi:hypothetical protein